MATITLYKDKINGVGSLLDDIIKSVNNLDVQLETLKNTIQGVDSSTCDLQDTVNSISSSSKSEKEKVADLKKLNGKLTEFIETTTKRDNKARDEINKAKGDFYTKYSHLKPECEKSRVEKIVDAMKSACEWCKEHWKLIATIVIVAVAVVLICTGVAAGAGAMLLGACWGAILGACIGGVAGGINSKMHGGSFLDGFEDGAFSGAITGGIMGGIMGGAQFKLTIRNIEKSGLTFENGKVEGKTPLDKYLKYRKMSVNNPDSDTMTLEKYEPTIRPDGTPDYSIPGPGAYTQKAGDTTYFSLGTEWDNITNTYNLDTAGKDMFKLFNQPALDDAVNAGKTIRFSHDPTAYGDCALKWEWDYLVNKHDFNDLLQIGDFWYGIK